MYSTTSLTFFAACVLQGAGTGALADSFKFPLTGAQCVPPVATSGTGSVEITYDPETRVVTWNIPYSGLSSAVTLAHFHGPTAQGKSAPVVVWLAERGSDSRASHADSRAGGAICCRRVVRQYSYAVLPRMRASGPGDSSDEMIDKSNRLAVWESTPRRTLQIPACAQLNRHRADGSKMLLGRKR